MTALYFKPKYDDDKIVPPFRLRRRMHDTLKFPKLLEQYLLAEAAGVVSHIMREEEAVKGTIVYGDNYWYFPDRLEGVTRPLLVAHVDTVCSPFPPYEVVRQGYRIINPSGVLGADDRAGVFAALELRKRTGIGVLLCDEEESGAHGARAAARELGDIIKRHPYMIELDRKGHRQVVYYRQECEAFYEHLESYGFRKEWGSFSDISVLSRELDLPGANVSIGFNLQHTKFEYLDLYSLWDTIERVQQMITENKDVIITPMERKIVHYNARRDSWRARQDRIIGGDFDVIDTEEVPELSLTPEQIDHMVALDLETREAEYMAYLEDEEREFDKLLEEEKRQDEEDARQLLLMEGNLPYHDC